MCVVHIPLQPGMKALWSKFNTNSKTRIVLNLFLFTCQQIRDGPTKASLIIGTTNLVIKSANANKIISIPKGLFSFKMAALMSRESCQG